MFFSGIPLFLD